MFSRLFGETEQLQLQYLKPKVIITAVSIALMIILAIFFGGGASALFALVMLFVWGWGAVKSLFGITTVGAIFSGNIVIGVILFVLYFMIAYLAGIVCAALGVGRYIYLLIKYKKEAT